VDECKPLPAGRCGSRRRRSGAHTRPVLSSQGDSNIYYSGEIMTRMGLGHARLRSGVCDCDRCALPGPHGSLFPLYNTCSNPPISCKVDECTPLPEMRCLLSNWISMNFPKRLELSLRTVLALPNASSSGLDSNTCAQGAYTPPLFSSQGGFNIHRSGGSNDAQGARTCAFAECKPPTCASTDLGPSPRVCNPRTSRLNVNNCCYIWQVISATKTAPKHAQEGPKTAPKQPKNTPHSPKTAPKQPQNTQCTHPKHSKAPPLTTSGGRDLTSAEARDEINQYHAHAFTQTHCCVLIRAEAMQT